MSESEKASIENPWVARVRKLGLCALVIYLAWLLVQGGWLLLTPGGDGMMVLSDKPIGASRNARQNRAQDNLARMHLFGKEGVGPVVKQEQPKTAPKTRLRLSLKGVFTAEQGGESGAIVEEIGKSTEYYRVGELLPGNAVLEEVYSDRILLRRNGQLETLAFEDGDSDNQSIARVNRPVTTDNEPDIATPEDFIEVATERLSQNPQKALGSVGLAQAEGGGYVYQGNNPMLAGMNLKKGDVIRSVNGHQLGNIQQDKELMRTLYEQGALEVEVVRDGASFFINYPLR